MPKAVDIGIDKSGGRWTAFLYGGASGPRFLFSHPHSLLRVRQYAYKEAQRTGGRVYIEGQPEEKYLPDTHNDRGYNELSRSGAICGVITAKDVFKNAPQIARDFGPGTLMRCCVAVAKGKKTTFLQCAFPPGKAGKFGRYTNRRRSRRSRRR